MKHGPRPMVLQQAKLITPTYMAFIETQSNKSESFQKFFESWLTEQNHHLQELISASKTSSDANLRPLVDRVVRHYELYYHVKSACTTGNVLSMLTPSWRSRLEDAFLWIGGWRPTMAFHLLFSKSGLQLEIIGLPDLARGLSTRDLADLSHEQLCRVDELQRQTIRDERELTESMASIQETAADSKMVKLSHLATEEGGGVEDLVNRVESTLAHKEKEMEEMVHKADEIRLRTLKGVLDILTTTQSVHFLIAAAELHLRLHEWGRKKDDEQQPEHV